MPTVFSNCEDCVYLDNFPIKHIVNTSYKRDIQTMNLLMLKKMPKEIAIKIVKMSKLYANCRTCGVKLCCNHLRLNDMGSPMCSNCSWFDIT